MKYAKIQEEELKNKVTQDFFAKYDCTEIIEKIDFVVKRPETQLFDGYFLWAEAKAASTDICEMLTQLVLTVGKTRTFDKITPPPFLGCFDREKIAFVPYYAVQEIFYQNDFNWNVTPSNRNTREFKQVHALIKNILDADISDETYLFDFEKDEAELRQFIRENFIVGKSETTKTRIDKNNFINNYNKWLDAVKPTIAVDWALAKKAGIIDGDFYLADLLSRENETLKDKLFVLLKSNHYVLDKKLDVTGFFSNKTADFKDNQKAHAQFWAIYERPPLEDYWDYIIERRDLLVPQDIRERKGSFFTPRIWVELSQQYIADVLGEDWQDEYYVWDCAAGTGNLLAGLTNKYNIWASTFYKADVDVMHDRIENGANLLEDHTFQFDFLNDDFSKLPEGLRDIIENENKRHKLVVYINPPYAEAGHIKQRTGTGQNKTGVATGNKTYIKYSDQLGKARNELFAQFLARIYFEIPGCIIAEFSKQKALIAPNFKDFRKFFLAKLKKSFIVPSYTFDNVKGKFPIGFKVWDTKEGKHFKSATVDVYDAGGVRSGKKIFRDGPNCKYINDWIKAHRDNTNTVSAKLCYVSNDFQNKNKVQICSFAKEVIAHDVVFNITQNNLFTASIYFAVRHCIGATWLNDRDQFLYPNVKYKTDVVFRNDCFAYTLFHGSNNIQSKFGVNHWIPFTEWEVNARTKFKSSFMTDFIAGKIERTNGDLFTNGKKGKKLVFSSEAKAVFQAGRKLWTYYHAQPKCNVNASLYDIREHFQGRNDTGRMNNTSDDETYNELIAKLRSALNVLAKKIEPKVYEYGFLKE